MNSITSAIGQHAARVHVVAGVVIIAASVWVLLELLAFAKQRRRVRASERPLRTSERPPEETPADSREPKPKAEPLLIVRPLEPTASDNVEPDPITKLPQVCLLCQDDVEPDEATFPYARILLSARGDTDAGKKRSGNEDSMLMLPEHSLFAVADGMGGYHGGKIASTLAVDTLRSAFDRTSFDIDFQSDTPIPRRARELASALVQANQAVFTAAQREPDLAEMGTTLVAARFSPDKRRVYVGHVGDSRCYRFRGSRLTQLTTDHTMRHLGLDGPHANDLFRAVGIELNVVIDLVVDIPHAEDIYLLCSDGLPKMVSHELIEEALRNEPDLEAAVYRLIELANDAGGRDNVTVIAVRVRDAARERDRIEQTSLRNHTPFN